jgi:hypothetical protein
MFFGYATSSFLVVDNVMREVILGVAFEGVSNGNVIAYNYTRDSKWYDNANRLMIINHGGGSMNLIEGNIIEGRYREDCYFASGHWNTVVRNRIEQQKNKDDQLSTFDIEQGHHYTAAIGNILGTPGHEVDYEDENENGVSGTHKVIYRLGYESPWETSAAGNDPQVKATLLRHGNWDSFTNGVVWDPNISDRQIPDSYYYVNGKPAWWGASRWPPFDPQDASTRDACNPQLPAAIRFKAANPSLPPFNNCGPADNVAPAAPTSLRVKP